MECRAYCHHDIVRDAQRSIQFTPPPGASSGSGGFECSTHCVPSGRHLDLITTTAHDVHAAADYRRDDRPPPDPRAYLGPADPWCTDIEGWYALQ